MTKLSSINKFTSIESIFFAVRERVDVDEGPRVLLDPPGPEGEHRGRLLQAVRAGVLQVRGRRVLLPRHVVPGGGHQGQSSRPTCKGQLAELENKLPKYN